ncbi:MAG: hypothetical protein A2885_20950 [Sphingopyxis sp. RIFCSPHIGHO2_01_FULL_65_24]|nr:MAG: hypothetical protein A2885_20950 [Sphingopyxis sp. RIFCSPHIGHO2_01_FULL_65_24]
MTDTNGALVSSGDLAEALDTRLTSHAPADADIRVALSFREGKGRICRSVEGRDLSGIGCRENGCWAQERTAAGRKVGEYRQVSSGDLTAAAAAMMPGNPFDAAAERAAWGA